MKHIHCKASLQEYNAHLKKVEDIVNIASPDSQFLFLGDYNLSDSITLVLNSDGICIPCKKKYQANAVVDMLSMTNLQQFNWVKNNLARTLDLVISNVSQNHLKVTEDIDPLSVIDVHHPPLLITVNLKPMKFLDDKRLPK